MARILITGSSDGIGWHTARTLISRGHAVTLHARSPERATQTTQSLPGAAGMLISDISTLAGMKQFAADANKLGTFDTVIHNAGVGYTQSYRKTADGLAHVFAINSLAPYVLTCLMHRPKRLIYVSSGLHTGGDARLQDLAWTGKAWNALQAYSDSKLQNVLMAFAVARRWGGIESVAMTPGWVKTKMGGAGAPGQAEEGAQRMIRLASEERLGSGKYFADVETKSAHSSAGDVKVQDAYLRECERISGLRLLGE